MPHNSTWKQIEKLLMRRWCMQFFSSSHFSASIFHPAFRFFPKKKTKNAYFVPIHLALPSLQTVICRNEFADFSRAPSSHCFPNTAEFNQQIICSWIISTMRIQICRCINMCCGCVGNQDSSKSKIGDCMKRYERNGMDPGVHSNRPEN